MLRNEREHDEAVLDGVIGVVLGAALLAFGLWRWRTPRDPDTMAAWRMFGAAFKPGETGLDWAFRTLRAVGAVLLGAWMIVGSLVRIATSLG